MRKFLVVLCLLMATPGLSFSHKKETRRLTADLEEADGLALAKRTDKALGALFSVAERVLKNRGHAKEALRLKAEWKSRAHYVERAYLAEGMGDHAPYSKWLEEKYFMLLALLGPELMEAFHLDDIGIFNWGIVVTLHLNQLGDDPIDLPEYRLHFEPFAGVLAYWGTWIACEVATSGTGWWVVCTPAGMIAEYVTVKHVAPRFSPGLYDRFY